jgi:hypothetical protein
MEEMFKKQRKSECNYSARIIHPNRKDFARIIECPSRKRQTGTVKSKEKAEGNGYSDGTMHGKRGEK